MTKKERIRLLTGVAVMALLFGAVASIGWTQDEFLITYYYGYDGKYEMHTVKKGYQKKPLEPGRYGHVFDGWYYNEELTVKACSDDPSLIFDLINEDYKDIRTITMS